MGGEEGYDRIEEIVVLVREESCQGQDECCDRVENNKRFER